MKKLISENDLRTAEEMLTQFVDGGAKQRSSGKAEEISVFFDQLFPDDDGAFDDLVTGGAAYRRKGGTMLLNETDFASLCRTGLKRIARLRAGELEKFGVKDDV